MTSRRTPAASSALSTADREQMFERRVATEYARILQKMHLAVYRTEDEAVRAAHTLAIVVLMEGEQKLRDACKGWKA